MRGVHTHIDVRSVHRHKVRHVTVHALCAENVRATGECVYTPVAHAVVATTWVRNTHYKKQNSSLHDRLDFFNSLLVLLVLVIPLSSNCDSLMELGQSPHLQLCSRFPKACAKRRSSCDRIYCGVSLLVPFEAKVVLRTVLVSTFVDNSIDWYVMMA